MICAVPAAVILIVFSCGKPEIHLTDNSHLQVDSSLGLSIADTITYEVKIVNPDPEDKWTAQCLSGLDHQALVDNIFDMIYNGEVTAYDYDTMEPLKTGKVEKMEKEAVFNRSDIGMIQFTEEWYLNPEDGSMTKKVRSMVLGKNHYNSEGQLFGYEPLFRVKMADSRDEMMKR